MLPIEIEFGSENDNTKYRVFKGEQVLKAEMKKIPFFVVTLLLLVVLGACSIVPFDNDNSSSETPIPDFTIPPTRMPEILPSMTSSSTFPPTKTPTITPLPILPPEERMALAEDMFRYNAGCRLPCWWGFTPGSTSWEEVKRYLESFASIVGESRGPEDNFFVGVQFQVPEELYFDDYPGFIWNTYFIRKNIIEAIEIDVPRVSTYNLPKMLREYGPPDEIYVLTGPSEFHPVYFSVNLFYKDLGILSNYSVIGEDLGESIQGCFGDERSGRLMVWAPEKGWSFEEVTGKMVGARISGYPLEEVSDFTVESFYQTFKEATSPKCINVPISSLKGE